MAEAKGRKGTEPAGADSVAGAATPSQSINLGIRLLPSNNSDQPVMANHTTVNTAPGMAFIDFGFVEPSILTALPLVLQQGGKLPKTIDGKLAVRVAMGYDALANMHQQIGRVLARASQRRAASRKS